MSWGGGADGGRIYSLPLDMRRSDGTLKGGWVLQRRVYKQRADLLAHQAADLGSTETQPSSWKPVSRAMKMADGWCFPKAKSSVLSPSQSSLSSSKC